MARTKQATPLRREPSSEYYAKGEEKGTLSRSPRNLDRDVGVKEATNGYANRSVVNVVEQVKEAGALQLVFAVGGIYGSL
jgi:UDP-galactose transporter B1